MNKRNILVPIIAALAMLTIHCGKKRFNKEAEGILKTLSLEEKIGQLIMCAVPGKKITPQSRKIIDKYKPGGIILFGYNVSEDGSVYPLINELKKQAASSSCLPLFVSVDQEGGRVKRLLKGVTQFPGNMASGIGSTTGNVYKWARILGIQLRLQGVNMNLAPVLDVNNNPENPVINTRSFGSQEEIVSRLGSAYIEGLQDSKCIAVAKHFPGHGDTDTDSHLALPVIRHTMKRLENLELVPFKEAIDQDVDGIMTAHIAYPVILKHMKSATLSPELLTFQLREKMKYKGLVISDDMEMNAISGKYDIGSAAIDSISAGTDIILISTYGENIKKIYTSLLNAVAEGVLTEDRIDRSVKRILETKLRYGILKKKKNGTVTDAVYKINDKRKALLEDSDKLNATMSRRAISFVNSPLDWGDVIKQKRVVITDNSTLTKVLKQHKDVSLFNSVHAFQKSKRVFNKSTIFYYLSSKKRGEFKKIQSYCTRNDSTCIIVYSGNPFKFMKWKIQYPKLLSFSSTNESITQLALCIAGEFNPKEKIPVSLGYND